ncbi:leucyl aminopeptidase [Thermoflexus sp.]|uniref:leucyl aminopeptidase n=1 Tax=Thermoflexus sp. TaxID=1969742 RepID=UPI002ADE2B81|nr:leucyl aminopeptidase [Thermoflexus sp.]
MQIEVRIGAIQEVEADAVVVNLLEGVTTPGGATAAVDRALEGRISRVLAAGDFRGRLGETLVLYTDGRIPAPRVILVGLGPETSFHAEKVRHAAAAAAQRARELNVRRLATVIHGAGRGGLSPEEAAHATVEGTLLGLYTYQRKRENADRPRPEVLLLVEFDAAKEAAIAAGARRAEILARFVNRVRDWVNEPGSDMTPRRLAEEARALAHEVGVRAQILEERAIVALGMGALAAVSRGSEEPPRFIILEYAPEGRLERPVVLAGKGITFDSGGLNLKSEEGMLTMKGDMAGAAAVLGATLAAAALQLPIPVVALAPACENMPSGKAFKPGDILRALNGKTIEIVSTDAEGRLILADALSYAARYNPRAVIDVATLTGAAIIALGQDVAAALFSDNDELAEALLRAAQATGERLWRMPLWEDYLDRIRSDVADVKNSGGRYGGLGTSAMFLKQFAPEGVPWAHLDIAPMDMAEKARGYVPKGGTGYGVRLLVRYLEDLKP